MSENFDVVVIGGGPGGYVAAIRCAQLGLNTVCIDKQVNSGGEPSLGGTCLNVGCIPSKALLDSSEQFHRLNNQFAAHGIQVENVSVDIQKMQNRKEGIVKSLTSGIAQLFKANKIQFIHGAAKVVAGHTVTVTNNDGVLTDTLTAQHIILAPGSTPVELKSMPFNYDTVVDSTGALNFDEVPERIGIIGAGVIGLELGSVWNRLGSKVIILEAMDKFLATADQQVSKEAARQFKKQGLDIRLGAMVKSVEEESGKITLTYSKGEKDHQEVVDRVIVAVGRRPATEGLLSPDCGVSTDSRGFIEVDNNCQTSVENIWAVGDAVRGPMLAHKSSEEGVAVAETIAGGHGHIDFNTVPWVIYTSPEIAWVGKTEAELKEEGVEFRSGSFPFAATGRAKAMEEPIGFVKMIADKKTDRILGVHMVGPHVSELIGECVLAMEFRASSEDLARTIHAHPTLSEAVHEAALAVEKRAIHKVN
ncbi:MAG: dihydrolipoyl dehydrogenase [Gammaproteobacteria bacterium]|nr:dihydrolipoyl dehydrogenase [Gammaproteobacteria bacterium]NKB63950.1 dihydrolipoyl dehydrogenase [Gammaproteobacteria bacterium]